MAFRCTSRHTNIENVTQGRWHKMSISARTFDGKKGENVRLCWRLMKKQWRKFCSSDLIVVYTKQKVFNMAADGRSLAGGSTSLGAEVLDILVDWLQIE